MPEVKLIVAPDGQTTLEFSGYRGQACLREAEQLRAVLARLGVQLAQDRFLPKPELEQPEISTSTTQEQSVGGQ